MNYLPSSFKDYFKQSYVSLSLAIIAIIVFIRILAQPAISYHVFYSFNAYDVNAIINGEYIRLLGWLFIHGDVLQLFFSILALLIIGSNLERLMGPLRFAAFYLLSGVITGMVLVFVHLNFTSINALLFGAAPAIAGSIAGLLFIQIRRPRWFDNTDVRVMWVFVAVYLIVIFGGLVLGLSDSVALFVYVVGIIVGALLSFGIMPKERYDG